MSIYIHCFLLINSNCLGDRQAQDFIVLYNPHPISSSLCLPSFPTAHTSCAMCVDLKSLYNTNCTTKYWDYVFTLQSSYRLTKKANSFTENQCLSVTFKSAYQLKAHKWSLLNIVNTTQNKLFFFFFSSQKSLAGF